MHSRKSELVPGSAVVLLGLSILWRSWSYGWVLPGGEIGPGFLPGISGASMAALGTFLVIKALVTSRASFGVQESPAGQEGHPTSRFDAPSGVHRQLKTPQLRRPVLVILLTLACVLAIRWVGFILAFGFFMLIVLVFVEKVGSLRAVLYAGGVSTAIWLVFVVGLQIPLPGPDL